MLIQEPLPESQPLPLAGRPYLASSRSPGFPAQIRFATGDWNFRVNALAGPVTEIASACRASLETARTGMVVWRGLPMRDSAGFSEFLKLLGLPPFAFRGGNAVRNERAGGVYDASIEPGVMNMTPHNELSYFARYPRLILFFCVRAADSGGEVVVNDTRPLLSRLPVDLVARFQAKGILYQKHLPDAKDCGDGGVSWQTAFFTEDKAVVEEYLAQQDWNYEWSADNALTYRFHGPVTIPHPDNGSPLWFNQITELHCSYWQDHPYFERNPLPVDRYPSHTYYGDGTPIETETIDTIRKVLWEEARVVKLQQGDMLVLDNALIQHGRLSYQGPRQHDVSMADWPATDAPFSSAF